MKKETRTTRLLSKKQSQKTVALGMVVTLFAPLLLAPIANAEEVPANEPNEVTQQLAETTLQQTEAPVAQAVQVPEEIVTPPAEETVVSEPMAEPIQTEVTESITVEESVEPAIVDTTTPVNESVQSITTETEESALPTNTLSEEVEESSSPDSTVITEYQGIIDGLAADIDELVTLGATATQVQGLRNGIGNLQYQLNEYSEGWQTKEEMDTLFVPWVSEMRAEIAELKELLSGEDPDINVTGVSLSELPELTVGETHQLTATVTPTNATNKGVSFSSSNPSIATVDANGLVTALSAGDYSITVTTTDGGFTATVSGTVKEVTPEPEVPVDGITLSQTALNLNEGDSAKLTATVTPENATDKTVVWSVDNEAVASIDSLGNVTGVKAGTAIVTITTVDGEYTATCTITVTKKTIIPPVNPVDPVDPKPEPTPDPTPEPKPLPTPSAPSLKDDPTQADKNNGTVKPLGTVANPSIDLSATNNPSKTDSLPKTGEVQTSSTTLLGMILVGITAIGAFIFKRKHSH